MYYVKLEVTNVMCTRTVEKQNTCVITLNKMSLFEDKVSFLLCKIVLNMLFMHGTMSKL